MRDTFHVIDDLCVAWCCIHRVLAGSYFRLEWATVSLLFATAVAPVAQLISSFRSDSLGCRFESLCGENMESSLCLDLALSLVNTKRGKELLKLVSRVTK